MKKFLIAATMATLAGATLAATANVGVTIDVGQPGFYGRIVLGNVPQPQVIYPSPVIIQQVPVNVVRQPIYLRVPPGHEKNWGKYCNRYNACGQPVYFVQNTWYRDVYAPAYRGDRGDRGDQGGRGDEHGNNGNHGNTGHGKGHGKGNGDEHGKKNKGHGND
jgi:hypothetical protein